MVPNIAKRLTKNLLKRLYDEIERLEKIHELGNANMCALRRRHSAKTRKRESFSLIKRNKV